MRMSIDVADVADIYARPRARRRGDAGAGWHRARAHQARARSRRALRRAVHGSSRACALGRGRCRVHRRAPSTHSTPRICKAFGYNYAGQQKVEIVNFCVSGFGMIDRPAIPKLAAAAARSRNTACGRSISAARSTTRRSMTAPRCRPAFALTVPRSWRNSARRQWCFRANRLEVDEHGILIVQPRARNRRGEPMNVQPQAWPWPTAPRLRRARHRSHRAANRRGHAQLDRGGDRIRHRAHGALADDPRSARLPRRSVRSLLPQADRAILFGDAERGGARFSARDHAAGRRFPDERHLSHRRLDRPLARSVQHRSGVSRRRGRRLYPGLRAPRRYRRSRAGLDARHRRDRVRGRPRHPADQALQRRRAQRRRLHHHQAQHARARHAGGRSRQRGAGLS